MYKAVNAALAQRSQEVSHFTARLQEADDALTDIRLNIEACLDEGEELKEILWSGGEIPLAEYDEIASRVRTLEWHVNQEAIKIPAMRQEVASLTLKLEEAMERLKGAKLPWLPKEIVDAMERMNMA